MLEILNYIGLGLVMITDLVIIGGTIIAVTKSNKEVEQKKAESKDVLIESLDELVEKTDIEDALMESLEELIEKVEDSGKLAREYYELEAKRQKENEGNIPAI